MQMISFYESELNVVSLVCFASDVTLWGFVSPGSGPAPSSDWCPTAGVWHKLCSSLCSLSPASHVLEHPWSAG